MPSSDDTAIFNYQDDIINSYVDKITDDEPFYVVDLNKIKEKYIDWKKLLPNVIPYYAVKCNPDAKIVKLLASLGSNFDCASIAEFDIVRSSGVSSDRIIYANPCKNKLHIECAKEYNIDHLVIDSVSELIKIYETYPNAKLVIRMKVDDSASECKFSTKFGSDQRTINNILKMANRLNINIIGISFHIGSNCKGNGFYMKAIKNARYVFDKAIEDYGMEMSFLDIGGGFPGINEGNISMDFFANEINFAINTYFGDLKNINIIAEPGRYFVTSSHTLAVNIINVKETNTGNSYTVNDGIYGSFNCVIFDHNDPIFIPLKRKNDRHKLKENLYLTTIFGPTCDSVDKITTTAMLPKLNIGDWCYIENFGAYTRASSSNFNGFGPIRVFYTGTDIVTTCHSNVA